MNFLRAMVKNCVAGLMLSVGFCSIAWASASTIENTSADNSLQVCAVPQLYDSLLAIKDRYVKEQKLAPETINFIFRPASLMYNQIQNKELKCDVFLGNDVRYPGLLIKSEVADPKSLHAFARVQLVLWSITSIVDESCKVLTNGVYTKISLPNPKTQASGYAALNALGKFGLDPQKIRSKLMYGANEYQTLSFIVNGNVIMGVLPKNLLEGSSFGKSGSFCVIPEQYYEPLYYYSVRLKTSKEVQANAFIANLHSDQAKQVFTKFGFK